MICQNSSIEIAAAFNTNGDKRFTTFAFSQQISKIQLSTRLMLGSGNFVVQPTDGVRYPFIDQDGSYIFDGGGFQPGVFPTDVGIKTFDTKTDHYLHVYTSVDYTIPIIAISSKTEFIAFVGPSLAYVDEVLVVEATDGTFTSLFYPETELTLTVTQYINYLDVGGHAQATLQHTISPKLGLRLSLNFYYFTDEQFSGQVGAGIAF